MMYMYWVLSVTLVLAACLVQLSLGQAQFDGKVFQVYPRPEDVSNGTTPLYFALMQSFSGGYRSSGGIPGLMVALDEINSNSTVLPGYSLHYTLSDNAVGLLKNFTDCVLLFGDIHDLVVPVATLPLHCSFTLLYTMQFRLIDFFPCLSSCHPIWHGFLNFLPLRCQATSYMSIFTSYNLNKIYKQVDVAHASIPCRFNDVLTNV